jgi:transcriptional regulator with XRE-family HTH domain
MELAEKIRHLRKQRAWSQAELGEKVGIHSGHVSRLETGRYQPSSELLKKLAQALEVSTDYLLNPQEGELSAVTAGDKSLIERVRLIESLDPEERAAVFKIIDGLLTKKKFVDLAVREARLVSR